MLRRMRFFRFETYHALYIIFFLGYPWANTLIFPYLSDHEMETLRWMAESYSNELPVYVPDSGRLLKGDRVRITSGSFHGDGG